MPKILTTKYLRSYFIYFYMKRRAALAVGCSIVGGSLTGCLKVTETNDSTRTDHSSTNSNSSVTDTAEEPTAKSTGTDTQSFYVWNDSSQTTCINIELQSLGNEEPLINNSFSIEKEQIVEFADIVHVGESYHVECSFEDGRDLTHEWTAEKCSEYAGGEEFEKSGYVKYSTDQAFFATMSCDAVDMEMSQTMTVRSTNVSNCENER